MWPRSGLQGVRVQSCHLSSPVLRPLREESSHLADKETDHFNILAWRIPWTEESGKLQSTGSLREKLICLLSLLKFHCCC